MQDTLHLREESGTESRRQVLPGDERTIPDEL